MSNKLFPDQFRAEFTTCIPGCRYSFYYFGPVNTYRYSCNDSFLYDEFHSDGEFSQKRLKELRALIRANGIKL